MLAAGYELMIHEGFTLDISSISFEELIQKTGSPRATVFRTWPDREKFVTELVSSYFTDSGLLNSPDLSRAVQNIRNLLPDLPEEHQGTVISPKFLTEAVHRIFTAYFAETMSSTQWRSFVVLLATQFGNVEGTPSQSIGACLKEIEDSTIDRLVTAFDAFNVVFDREPSLGISTRDMAITYSSFVYGLILRSPIQDPADSFDKEFQVEPDGLSWTLPALNFCQIYTNFTQPKPSKH